jgi:hypothetical protein
MRFMSCLLNFSIHAVLIDCSTGLIVGCELYGDMLDAKLKEIL